MVIKKVSSSSGVADMQNVTGNQQTGEGWLVLWWLCGGHKTQEGNFDSRGLILDQLPTFGLDPKGQITITLQNSVQ